MNPLHEFAVPLFYGFFFLFSNNFGRVVLFWGSNSIFCHCDLAHLLLNTSQFCRSKPFQDQSLSWYRLLNGSILRLQKATVSCYNVLVWALHCPQVWIVGDCSANSQPKKVVHDRKWMLSFSVNISQKKVEAKQNTCLLCLVRSTHPGLSHLKLLPM